MLFFVTAEEVILCPTPTSIPQNPVTKLSQFVSYHIDTPEYSHTFGIHHV